MKRGLKRAFLHLQKIISSKNSDLNTCLIKHPQATFFVNVEGDSMKNANNEFTVKRLHKSQDKILLLPENKKYAPIEITEEMDFIVWGVVTYIIHRAK